MICNNKQQALKRINYLANKVNSVPCSDLMKWIISTEIKDHIKDWKISREDILALETA